MKKIKTSFSNKIDTGQNKKPEGHEDIKLADFPTCGLSYYLEQKMTVLS